MSDISIVKRREKATIFPLTKEGEDWMHENLIMIGVVHSIPVEEMEDMIKILKEAGLEVETL